jgi:ubiquinone/menaquinone biosynthesis C-methylase UbiE
MLALPAHYEAEGVAADYRRRFSKSPARVLSHFLEMRMLAKALRIAGRSIRLLDVPCGAGRLVPTLSAHAQHVVCVDAAAAMLREARVHVGSEAGAAFARASAFTLPFADAAFDVAVCWRLLHHFDETASRRRLLAELRRVARAAVVLSFSDAETPRGKRLVARAPRAGRRTALTRDALALELSGSGLAPRRFFRLFGPLSSVACVVATPAT